MNRKTNNTISRITLSLLAVIMLLGSVAEARPYRQQRNARAQRQVVNINQATGDQLQFLPGIGPSKSRAIVRYRARRKFKSAFQIVRVKGIGRKTYRKLRPYLTITGPTTVTAKLKIRKEKDDQ